MKEAVLGFDLGLYYNPNYQESLGEPDKFLSRFKRDFSYYAKEYIGQVPRGDFYYELRDDTLYHADYSEPMRNIYQRATSQYEGIPWLQKRAEIEYNVFCRLEKALGQTNEEETFVWFSPPPKEAERRQFGFGDHSFAFVFNKEGKRAHVEAVRCNLDLYEVALLFSFLGDQGPSLDDPNFFLARLQRTQSSSWEIRKTIRGLERRFANQSDQTTMTEQQMDEVLFLHEGEIARIGQLLRSGGNPQETEERFHGLEGKIYQEIWGTPLRSDIHRDFGGAGRIGILAGGCGGGSGFSWMIRELNKPPALNNQAASARQERNPFICPVCGVPFDGCFCPLCNWKKKESVVK